jgi:2-amino-4-hydroxy-6-hydroxymethyldihydropteridine diphosphokinase
VTAVARHEVAIGLGSNIGDKAGTIRRALAVLEAAAIVAELKVSHFYSTAPWGPVAQEDFVNACAVGVTGLDPETLLIRCKAVEVTLGRTDTIRWGPRVIDIDLLFYDDLRLASPRLTLPHVDLFNRAFVLVPLAELCPERRIGGIAIGQAAAAIDRSGVKRLG